ncbi:MAG: hypothetical protein JST39_12090 [Bacteroidetes bacterium]|nr:hypothetical protein [Bacteroidota bacterium]
MTKRLALILLLMAAALGHVNSPVMAAHFTAPAVMGDKVLQANDKHSLPVVRSVSAKPSRQNGKSEKRHKRVVISKIFRAEPFFTFVPIYRVIEPVCDYSHTHIIQRPAAVFPLRGPPVCAFLIA